MTSTLFNRMPQDTADSQVLVKFLTGRYGALALTRAAGEAASARRKGDNERSVLLNLVIADLRRTMNFIEADRAPV